MIENLLCGKATADESAEIALEQLGRSFRQFAEKLIIYSNEFPSDTKFLLFCARCLRVNAQLLFSNSLPERSIINSQISPFLLKPSGRIALARSSTFSRSIA